LRNNQLLIDKLVPQMRTYSDMYEVLMPYITTAPTPLYRSAVVNTDEYGFRHSSGGSEMVDSMSWWDNDKRGIILGGSFTFGVGATADDKTVASALNSIGSHRFLNLGIRAANSTQGLVASIPFLSQSDAVIICGGFNTLVANIQSIGRFDLYGPFAQEHLFARMTKYSLGHLESVVRGAAPVSLSPTVLLREGIRRFKRAITGTLLQKNRSGGGLDLDFETDEAHVHRRVERALAIQRRDLQIIAKSVGPSARVIFALQPFGLASKLKLTDEERLLFELRAPENLAVRDLVYRQFLEIWPQYTVDLREICRDVGVVFTDLNDVKLDGWCYVDPAHMTDNGYQLVAQHLGRLLS
jgi:hypothetical protein